MMALGQYLRRIREEEECSIRALARKSGYSVGYLSDIESGKKKPGPFALRCIAEAMNLEPEEKTMAASLLIKPGAAC